MIISLSLIAADQANLGEAVRKAERWGADRLHFDIEDGTFSPRFGLNARTVSALRGLTALPFEIHLMVCEPERHLENFVKVGCNVIYIHPESTSYLRRTLSMIRVLGAKPGVALNPATPLTSIGYALDCIEALLVLTTEPDEFGETFIPGMEEKIQQVHALTAGLPIEIIVDGGVTLQNATRLVKLGATGLVIGRAIWQAPSPSSLIAKTKLKNASNHE